METVTTNNSEVILEDLVKKTRKSFTNVGLPINLDFEMYYRLPKRRYCDQESLSFLNDILSFYSSLKNLEQKVFVYEFIQKGQHFAYWYEEYITRKTFLKIKRNVSLKIMERFYGN